MALDYVELDHDLKEIAALDQEEDDADKLAQIEQQRVAAGVDPRIAELQAELTAAQVDEKRIHLENDADEMRQKLAHLTGLPADGLTPVSSSVPPPPTLSTDGEDQLAAQNNAGIAAAYANAKSKFFVAFGDARQKWRPTVSFGAEYGYLEPFADYTTYYKKFTYNNAGIGFQITLPIFDAAKRAQAQASAAAAAQAQAQADESRNKISEQTLTLQRTVSELAAQQRVAQIQNQIAQEQLTSVEGELANGTGSPLAPTVTPIQARQAEIQERERYEDLLDANFALMKVELNLLRATGQITNWIQSSLK